MPGGFNLDKSVPEGGSADPLMNTTTEIPKGRLSDDPSDAFEPGIRENLYTFSITGTGLPSTSIAGSRSWRKAPA